MEKTREIIEVHCDGSCTQTRGGIGIVIISKYTENLICRGTFFNTTNNRMELLAFIYSVYYLQKSIEDKVLSKEVPIHLYTDSKYLVDGYNQWLEGWINNNWQNSNKQTVLNLDLWKEIQQIKKILLMWLYGKRLMMLMNLIIKQIY